MKTNILKKRYRTKFIQKDSKGNLYCYKCKIYKEISEFDNSPQESDVFYREGKDRRCKLCKKEQYTQRRLQNRGKKDLNRILLERYHGMKERSVKRNIEFSTSLSYIKEL